MGTKGLVGVRFNDELHLIYQSHDSQPGNLGEEVVNFVQTLQNDPLRMLLFTENIQKVEWVNNTFQPTPEQVEKLSCYPEILVHLDYNRDWYTQFVFDPVECLEYVILFELPIIPEHQNCVLGEFNYHSPIEYAYILDLNRGILELYRHGSKMKEFSFEDVAGAQRKNWSNTLMTWEDY